MFGDTIVALTSPPGRGERAVVRLSGPHAFAAVAALAGVEVPCRRAQCELRLRLPQGGVDALLLAMPAPHSYTGEHVAELHLPGSPLLGALVERALCEVSPALPVRAALPGEFTRRAYEHGRLDLSQAEAVLALIHAADRSSVRSALAQLGGAFAVPLREVRAAVQDALAALESGLDFGPGETGAVDEQQWQRPLAAARARLAELAAALPAARGGGGLLLLGAANAGKSSLCNALSGRDLVLVSTTAGTTRDVLRIELPSGATLFDAPGDFAAGNHTDRAGLALRDRVAAGIGGALLVIDPGNPVQPATDLPLVAAVITKLDLGLPPPQLHGPAADLPQFPTSARTGAGLADLQRFLTDHARAAPAPTGECRAALTQALAALDRAVAAPGPELIAVELQQALAALAPYAGEGSPEDLLDRIFARFCLGK